MALQQILETPLVKRAIAQVCRENNQTPPSQQLHPHLYPRRLVSFPATNPNFGQGYPMPHWELRVDSPGDVLRDAQISDIDAKHARITQDIDDWTTQTAGPNWKEGVGLAKATRIATQKMMDLGTEKYQADAILVEQSETAWREYMVNVMSTEGEHINWWQANAR